MSNKPTFGFVVEVIQPLKQMAFGKVFAIKDPAGRPLYLVELSANRLSRPVN